MEVAVARCLLEFAFYLKGNFHRYIEWDSNESNSIQNHRDINLTTREIAQDLYALESSRFSAPFCGNKNY